MLDCNPTSASAWKQAAWKQAAWKQTGKRAAWKQAHKRTAGSNHDSRHSRAAYNAPIDRKIDSNELNDLTVEYATPSFF